MALPTQGVALGLVWLRAFGPADQTAHGGGGSIHGVWLRAFGPADQTAHGGGEMGCIPGVFGQVGGFVMGRR